MGSATKGRALRQRVLRLRLRGGMLRLRGEGCDSEARAVTKGVGAAIKGATEGNRGCDHRAGAATKDTVRGTKGQGLRLMAWGAAT